MIEMQWGLANRGQLRKEIAREQKRIERGITKAIRLTAFRERKRLASKTTSALGPRMGRTWAVKLFPEGQNSAEAAALVFSRAPAIIDGHASGQTIRAQGNRYLAIPTAFNRSRAKKADRGKPFAGTKVTPEQMAKSGRSFVRPGKNGARIWYLQVSRDVVGKTAKGRDRRQIRAGGLVRVSGSASRNGISSKDALKGGAIAMYVLIPELCLPRRLNPPAEFRKSGPALAREVALQLG